MDDPENPSSTHDLHASSENSQESFSLLHPPKIGRYSILRRLGKGGFGEVFLAFDEELERSVAIKVPRPERVSQPEDIEAYLTEARIVANLDHPNIVPVYDLGRTDDGLCFVVSKFIEGSDLASNPSPTNDRLRSCPRDCGPSINTTPISSSNCSPALVTRTGCPTACGS